MASELRPWGLAEPAGWVGPEDVEVPEDDGGEGRPANAAVHRCRRPAAVPGFGQQVKVGLGKIFDRPLQASRVTSVC